MHRDKWTAGLVVRELTAVLSTARGLHIEIYSPRINRFNPLAGGPVGGPRLIGRTAEILGRENPDRLKLLVYCRYIERRHVSRIAREHGWNRASVYNAKNRAAASVALSLNVAWRRGHPDPFEPGEMLDPLELVEPRCPCTA